MTADSDKAQLNPMAMSLADTARLLSKVTGENIEPEMIQEDIDEGAHTNPDGSISLVCYAAWLVKELSNRAN